jgi:tRNA/tmRNA/rRNA uracil-C5-methylase (TrmA/RlmC/RlmD family)
MLNPGTPLTLTIEKPAAGGRMLARHHGQIVFVSATIPGERVRAIVEQERGGVVYAQTDEVLDPSPHRREAAPDPLCGGLVYSHIAYVHQLTLKSEIVADAFARIGRLPLQSPVAMTGSPERAYRMRARLHVRGSRIGFFREGTHEVCQAGLSWQLLPETADVVSALDGRIRAGAIRDIREIELSENIAATERVFLVHVVAEAGQAAAHRVLGVFDDGRLTGVGIMRAGTQPLASRGTPFVNDVVRVTAGGGTADIAFRRHAASFFQGNRYLLPRLIGAVLAQTDSGPLIDLYAGAGLFGISYAALRRGHVTAVEGDRTAADDLEENARPYAERVAAVTTSVESYVARSFAARDATILVDPPRTGMSKEACIAISQAGAPRVVYVSCDVATLARDVRRFLDAGYRLTHIEAFDLFPNTAHVETLVRLDRGA